MSTKSKQAISSIKSGDKQTGRRLLTEIIEDDPKNEIAWLWLTKTVDTLEQQRQCLQQVLSINPKNVTAIQALAAVEQKLAKQKKTQSNENAVSSSLGKLTCQTGILGILAATALCVFCLLFGSIVLFVLPKLTQGPIPRAPQPENIGDPGTKFTPIPTNTPYPTIQLPAPKELRTPTSTNTRVVSDTPTVTTTPTDTITPNPTFTPIPTPTPFPTITPTPTFFYRPIVPGPSNGGGSNSGSDDDDDSSSSPGACCKICKKGKACGNTCISRDKQCHVGRGCACDG